ncbi:MAG TPA: gliding motility-associated ABC transporter substrate-binding protein GldG [Flavobacteriales bacterium]|nr:gliding motility-associated ABC transporter substrate-binding protein GldG [Flavobacteriales bacterium]
MSTSTLQTKGIKDYKWWIAVLASMAIIWIPYKFGSTAASSSFLKDVIVAALAFVFGNVIYYTITNFAFALVKKEIRSFLSLLIGYIVISVFLLLMGLFLWVFPFQYNITDGGYASLDYLFDLAPWVFLFLIPAITMRSFAEERRNGTMELLLTKPLSDLEIIVSKYIGGLVLVIFSIIPTFIYYYSVKELGDPPGNLDTGGTFGSYIGLFCIGATFVSIGIFCSSLTQNQVVAFILAVFLSFFIYLGFDQLASFGTFGQYQGFVRQLGIYEHYQSIKRGVVDTRDLLYFVSVIVLFILFTMLGLAKRKGGSVIESAVLIASICILNFIGGFQFMRFDLTEEKVHSLSPRTIEFLQNETNIKSKDGEYKGTIDIKIYLTGELPADLKYLEKSIKEKLDEMRAYTGSRLNYEFIDPNESEDEEERKKLINDIYYEKKLKFTELQYEADGAFQTKYIFPGAVVSFEGQQDVPVQFFTREVIYKNEIELRNITSNAVEKLEFKLVDGIRRARDLVRPAIAVLQGHGEVNKDEFHVGERLLSEFYTVDYVSIDNKIKALDPYKVLLVVQPDSAFSEKDKFVIDQFIMRGGKVAWFVDPMDVPRDTLFRKGQTFGLSKDLRLDDQLFTYGVRINKDIVIDKSCAPVDVPGYPGNFAEWPFYPLVYSKANHITVNKLNPIKFEYASSIDIVGDSSMVKKKVILKSSDKAMIFKTPVRINYGILNIEPFSSTNLKPGLPLGVFLEGKFRSVFKNRLPDAFTKTKDYRVLDESQATRMLVVGDGDVVKNYYQDSVYNDRLKTFGKNYLSLEYDRYQVANPDGSPKFIYGNGHFLMNAVDYLLGEESLIELRQRRLTIRKLDDSRVMKEKSYWQFLNVGLPLIIIVVFGIVQTLLRKRKYETVKNTQP